MLGQVFKRKLDKCSLGSEIYFLRSIQRNYDYFTDATDCKTNHT